MTNHQYNPSSDYVGDKPRLLDLFAGAGGAARGYQEAGFEVVGVDITPQPNYPSFEAYVGDALAWLDGLANGELFATGPFDAVHASPPCQRYSPLSAYNDKEYPDLVEVVREQLERIGLPYVIENVPQAPLHEPTVLCGGMFGLKLYRHRGFETSFPLLSPPHPPHTERCVRNGYLPTEDAPFMSIHGGRHSKAWQKKAAEVMGVPWMTEIVETCEAIPPAYTRLVGEQLAAHLEASQKATA